MKDSRKLSRGVIDDEAKPKAKPYRIWDTQVPQLYLRVQPSGIKSFNVQWTRASSRSLGKWPGVTVEAARQKARDALTETDRHGAPLAVIEADKPKLRINTLREFIEQEFKPWASANRKWGDGAADRILSVFAEFADKPLASLNAWIIEKWRSRRIKDGTSANTCNRDLATLKSALARAVEWGLLEANPLAAVKQAKVDSTRVRYLTLAEERRLRSALAERDHEGREARARANAWRAERGMEGLPKLAGDAFADHLTPAVLLSLNTGLRRGELTALTWTDIDLKGKHLTVQAAASKSGRKRVLPLNVEAVDVLKRWHRQQGDAVRPFPFRDFKTAWTALLSTAKIDNFRWHDLRHAFASKLVAAGVDLNTLRELMGHADLKMVLRYAHLQPDHLAAAVAKLVAK